MNLIPDQPGTATWVHQPSGSASSTGWRNRPAGALMAGEGKDGQRQPENRMEPYYLERARCGLKT